MTWRRPSTIARQARHAHGLVGRVVATIMARETWPANRTAIAALDIAPAHRVLDVGCGHGRGLAALAAAASGGGVVGVDPSDLMVGMARRRNRRLVRAGRVEVLVGRAEALPVATASIDRLLCVHTLYFWDELAGPLGEMARVLKPGGRVALLFRPLGAVGAEAFPPEVYRFRSDAAVGEALEAAGFAVRSVGPAGGADGAPTLMLAERIQQPGAAGVQSSVGAGSATPYDAPADGVIHERRGARPLGRGLRDQGR